MALLGAFTISTCSVRTHAKAIETDLQLNLSGVTIQAENASGTMNVPFTSSSFSGKLVFGSSNSSTLAVGIDSTPQSSYNGTIIGFNGEVTLSSGKIAGGQMSVLVQNPDTSVDVYSYNVVNNSGSVSRPASPSAFASQGYSLSGLTSDGLLSDANFGGVDVSTWFNQQPLEGSFLQFNYHPDSAGFDNNSSVNITAIGTISSLNLPAVPLPRSVWAGALLMFGFGGWRKLTTWRRRLA